VDKIARDYGFKRHTTFASQFPNSVGYWNRKAREQDQFTTLGCFIDFHETSGLLKVRVVRFPGTSLTPAGEGLYRDIRALIEKRGYRAQVIFDE
jgi:hypothetical protein